MTEPELWSTEEIAEYLRKERKTIQNRVVHLPGFPKPVRGSDRPKLYPKVEVIEFLVKRR